MEGEDSQGKAALPVAPMEIADSELPPLTPEDTSVAPEKPSETKETARTTMDTESDLPPLMEDPTEQIPTEKQALPTSSEPEPEKTTEPSSRDNTENTPREKNRKKKGRRSSTKKKRESLSDYQLALQLQNEALGSFMDIDILGMIDPSGEAKGPKEFLTGSFLAFPPSLLDRSDYENGNKVVLPPSVLAGIRDMSGRPLLFQLKNAKLPEEESPVTYCGVVEFSSPEENIIVLPTWMMTKLLTEQGGELIVTRCDELPLGAFVRFQPLTSEFAELPNPKATLEEYLSYHYSTLTEGETIKIKQEDQIFELKVVECKPAPSICIVETSLKVEFDAAVEGPKVVHEQLKLGAEKLTAHVEAGEAKYYMILLDKASLEDDIAIHCEAISGDPDLYVHQQERFPGRKNYIWSNESKGSKELLVSWADPRRQPTSVIYVAVQGYKQPTDFAISAVRASAAEETNKRLKTAPEQDQGQTLGSVSGDEAPSAEHKRCTNCLRWIEGKAFSTHDAVCHRQNYRCPVSGCGQVISVRDKASHIHCEICSKLQNKDDPHYHCEICAEVLPVAAKEKHMEVTHGKLDCECGASLGREEYMLHKQFECPKRKLNCKYCQRPIPFEQLIYHQEECGATTMPCDVCSKYVVLKKMEIHYAAEHGRMYQGKGSAPMEDVFGQERKKEIDKTIGLNLTKFPSSAPTTPTKPSPAKPPAPKPAPVRKLAESGYACPNCGLMCTSVNQLTDHMLLDCIATKEF